MDFKKNKHIIIPLLLMVFPVFIFIILPIILIFLPEDGYVVENGEPHFVVEDFYKHVNNRNSLLKEESLYIDNLEKELANKHPNTKGINPITCAKDSPISSSYKEISQTNNKAQVEVTNSYGESNVKINVFLDFKDYNWIISDVVCE